MYSLLFLAYTNPNVVLRATNTAFWVLMVLRRAREQSLTQKGNSPARSCTALAGMHWAAAQPGPDYCPGHPAIK